MGNVLLIVGNGPIHSRSKSCLLRGHDDGNNGLSACDQPSDGERRDGGLELERMVGQTANTSSMI